MPGNQYFKYNQKFYKKKWENIKSEVADVYSPCALYPAWSSDQ